MSLLYLERGECLKSNGTENHFTGKEWGVNKSALSNDYLLG